MISIMIIISSPPHPPALQQAGLELGVFASIKEPPAITASYHNLLINSSGGGLGRREIKLALGRGGRGLGKRYFDVDC